MTDEHHDHARHAADPGPRLAPLPEEDRDPSVRELPALTGARARARGAAVASP
jgi:hypothetical protein